MSEEFSTLPDISQLLAQRIAAKAAANSPLPPPGTADPYQVMLQRKKQMETGEVQPSTIPIQKWPEEDVKALEDYCQKNGIIGFATRSNPKLALMQLKRQFGDFSGVPLEDRLPEGYEKMGTHSAYGPNYPYSQAIAKKQVIHG